MWEEGARIYGTPGVYNNFPSYTHVCVWKLQMSGDNLLADIWYMHLKIKNIYLKICVKICVGEKICENTYNII